MQISSIPVFKDRLPVSIYGPALSVVFPFEPKMTKKAELLQMIKSVTEEAEVLLLDYHAEIALLMMNKLRDILEALDFNTYRISVAVFLSPVFQKILYIDFPLVKSISVKKSFNMRELLQWKKVLCNYLIVVLTEKENTVLLHYNNSLNKLTADKIDTTIAANFKDLLTLTDKHLDYIFRLYKLPLIAVGDKALLQQFRGTSRHAYSVVKFAEVNLTHFSIENIREVLQPVITKWDAIRQKFLLRRLETASLKRNIYSGLDDVKKHVKEYTGSLLVLDATLINSEAIVKEGNTQQADGFYHSYSCIHDPVDEIIEAVLTNKGDVELIYDHFPSCYNHIAVIPNRNIC